MVDLKWCRVTKIDYENTVAIGTQMKLKNNLKYNVRYIDGENRCIGALEFRIADEDLKPFSIKVNMEAMFTYEPGDERDEIHVTSFDQIFPFLRQTVSSVTTMSGMAGLIIPLMRLQKKNVVINGTPEPDEGSMLN